jgi:hypothetical protein
MNFRFNQLFGIRLLQSALSLKDERPTILPCLVRLYLYQYTLTDIEQCNTVHNV